MGDQTMPTLACLAVPTIANLAVCTVACAPNFAASPSSGSCAADAPEFSDMPDFSCSAPSPSDDAGAPSPSDDAGAPSPSDDAGASSVATTCTIPTDVANASPAACTGETGATIADTTVC